MGQQFIKNENRVLLRSQGDIVQRYVWFSSGLPGTQHEIAQAPTRHHLGVAKTGGRADRRSGATWLRTNAYGDTTGSVGGDYWTTPGDDFLRVVELLKIVGLAGDVEPVVLQYFRDKVVFV